MQVETTNLRTVANYAKMESITPAAIYKREKDGQLNFVLIDEVKFVDIKRYPPKKK